MKSLNPIQSLEKFKKQLLEEEYAFVEFLHS
jgi:hypothetical protein